MTLTLPGVSFLLPTAIVNGRIASANGRTVVRTQTATESTGAKPVAALPLGKAGVSQQAREQLRADGNRLQEDVLVWRVRTATLGAETVEDGDPQRPDEVSVRSAA